MARRHHGRPGDLNGLVVRLEELVLAGSGEDGLEVVLELVIAKLWDEHIGGGRFRVHQDAAVTRGAVLELLSEAADAWPETVTGVAARLSSGHLQVCVEVLAHHLVDSPDLEVIDALFEGLVARTSKGAKGQYFTPRHVVQMCVELVRPRAGESVLDPACGSGGFLIHCAHRGAVAYGCDIDRKAIRVARALLRIADACADVRCLDALAPPQGGNETIENTFADPHAAGGFDVIMTNPPFAGEIREPDLLRAYELSRSRSRIERDVLFVERCVNLLKPGGRLAIVLPHNKLGAETYGFFREWLLDQSRVLAVVGLTRETFLPHTCQKTGVLVVRKRSGRERGDEEESTFFAISEQGGKDRKGRPLLRPGGRRATPWESWDHDLDAVVRAYGDWQATHDRFQEAAWPSSR